MSLRGCKAPGISPEQFPTIFAVVRSFLIVRMQHYTDIRLFIRQSQTTCHYENLTRGLTNKMHQVVEQGTYYTRDDQPAGDRLLS